MWYAQFLYIFAQISFGWILCFSLDKSNQFDSTKRDDWVSQTVFFRVPFQIDSPMVFDSFNFFLSVFLDRSYIETRLFCLRILMFHCACVIVPVNTFIVNEVCWSWNEKTRLKSFFFIFEEKPPQIEWQKLRRFRLGFVAECANSKHACIHRDGARERDNNEKKRKKERHQTLPNVACE